MKNTMQSTEPSTQTMLPMVMKMKWATAGNERERERGEKAAARLRYLL